MMLLNVYNLGFSAGKALGSLISRHTPPPVPSPAEAWDFLVHAPSHYANQWSGSDPVHFVIETTLVLSVLYILSTRNKDWREEMKEKLTPTEREELLRQWKEQERTPLAPATYSESPAQAAAPVVVYAVNARTIEVKVADEKKTKTVLNFATLDYLGMSANQPVKDASRDALSKYGCGSCGPRGFYGTIDVHLELEDAIAKFTGTDGAIMYSDGASTVSSTVAAFAKRGDLLVVDDGVYEPLLTGIALSRANIQWFRHNDMADLRRVLEKMQKTDKALGRKPNDQRRFIVVEGLYKNTGSVVPLDELVALKHEFEYRLILDESSSFGTLGETGRGVLELYGKRHMYDAEIVTISLENALGSVGGVTVGNEEIVDHQRLSGAGYCFSASSPPFTASAAIRSLEQLQLNPDMLESLQKNRTYFYKKMRTILDEEIPNQLRITSDERSSLVFLEVADVFFDSEEQKKMLQGIAKECLGNGVALVCTERVFMGSAHAIPQPALRLTVSAALTEADIDKGLSVLKKAILAVM